ncbi:zinc finger CCCH domain-containing protein 8-like isoform X3 [Boleophthalmus pectinirostris]|uniref:zinc finger CCCH domain-containing protein 8-like isoform X3 n=1 Tax=Boleophthalmus pectinirostris TaxID=150288 RepID=UPI00242D8645|nr:zinc finger CCCH domain-containing protein 8-like isoform X3 [Boleophthalmus pectinirostris]
MAFSNLFTKLHNVDEEVKDPNHRNNTINGQEGSSKRKLHTTQSGPYVKRQCPEPYAAGTSNAEQNEEPKTYEAHRFNRANNNPRSSVSRNAFYRNNQRTFSSDDNNRGNTSNATTQKKKTIKNKRKKKTERPRQPFMSQDFKEQHSLEVDGHLLCIHFIRGRCIKGEECQFEHIEVYNGLIKEACKFYIQGCCLKGKMCPYLHETFPCKFFHTKGYCRRDPCTFLTIH